jgi:hypoxanthine phosphoribosyltransferase
MQRDVEEVLIDRGAIATRVEALARQIALDFAGLAPAPDGGGASGGDSAGVSGGVSGGDSGGEPELTLVPILTGSIVFVADLIRCLPLLMQVRLVAVSSYPGAATTSKGARIREELTGLPTSLRGAHVLAIDDILDSGRTLALVLDLLRQRGPATLRSCVLLRKQRPEAIAFPVDYVGFDIPDRFVVGYGLDFNDRYRNLPEIVTLRPEVLARGAGGKTP